MALKPQGNNILAGTSLAIAQIQSPDFITGVSGWIVRQDGSAEFNNLVIRGTFEGTDFIINSLGAFFYTGTPATGNLFASIAPAAGANDGEGNAFQAGFTVYDGSGTFVQVHVNGTIGAPAIEQVTGAGTEAEHTAFYTTVTNPHLVNEFMGMVLNGPGSTVDNTQAGINLISATHSASAKAAGILGTIVSGVFTNRAFWDTTGFQVASPGGGNGWYANGTQTDSTSHPQTNIVTPSFGNVSAAWTIPANDANAGTNPTIYEVELPFTGVHEGIQLNIGINFAGTFTNVVPVLASWITTAHSYVGTIKLKLTCTATGSSTGAFNVDIEGTANDSGVNRGPATSTALDGHAALSSVNTTIANAFAVAVNWASTNASQSFTGLGSTYRRNGQ